MHMDMSGGGVACDYVLQCIPKDLLHLAFLVNHVDYVAMVLWAFHLCRPVSWYLRWIQILRQWEWQQHRLGHFDCSAPLLAEDGPRGCIFVTWLTRITPLPAVWLSSYLHGSFILVIPRGRRFKMCILLQVLSEIQVSTLSCWNTSHRQLFSLDAANMRNAVMKQSLSESKFCVTPLLPIVYWWEPNKGCPMCRVLNNRFF